MPERLPSRRRATLTDPGRMLCDRARSEGPRPVLGGGGGPSGAPCSERRMPYGSGPSPARGVLVL